MKKPLLITAVALIILFLSTFHLYSIDKNIEIARKKPLKRDKSGAKSLQWELGIETWTIRTYPISEQIELTKAMDLDYIELSPDFAFVKGSNVNIFKLNPEQKEKLKKIITDSEIPIKQLYVHIPKKETGWRKAFNVAKEYGFEVLIAEPLYEDFPVVEKLCKEYDIKVAIHNHPNIKNLYWNPGMAIKHISFRDHRIGLNPDLGHWMRMNVNPLKEISRSEVSKRIISIHLNDVKTLGVKGSPHVTLGTGACNIKKVLKKLKKQGYKGTFTIELGGWKTLDNLYKSIEFFDSVAAEIAEK